MPIPGYATIKRNIMVISRNAEEQTQINLKMCRQERKRYHKVCWVTRIRATGGNSGTYSHTVYLLLQQKHVDQEVPHCTRWCICAVITLSCSSLPKLMAYHLLFWYGMCKLPDEYMTPDPRSVYALTPNCASVTTISTSIVDKRIPPSDCLMGHL